MNSRSKKLMFNAVCLVIVCMNANRALAQDVCSEALVLATYSSKTSSNVDWRLADSVDSSTYDEIKKDGSGSATIYGVPIGADYSEFRNNVQQYKSTTTQSLKTAEASNIKWTMLDSSSPNAYIACLNSKVLGQPGLHAAVALATKTNITIRLTWTPVGKAPKTAQLTWTGVPESLRQELLDQGPIVAGSKSFSIPRPQQEYGLTANTPGYQSETILITPLPPPVDSSPLKVVEGSFSAAGADLQTAPLPAFANGAHLKATFTYTVQGSGLLRFYASTGPLGQQSPPDEQQQPGPPASRTFVLEGDIPPNTPITLAGHIRGNVVAISQQVRYKLVEKNSP